MNSKLFLTLALSLSATFAVQAQDDDDLYFTPTKKSQTTTPVSKRSSYAQDRYAGSSGNASSRTFQVYNGNSRNDDEYNRRYSGYAGSWQTGSIDSLSADSLDAEMEYEDSSQGYDLEDPECDYAYSRRILRFHSPRFGFAISSPYYWDLVYGWGVYDYLYDPYYDYFYDPFYWSWGWGFGWSYRPWNAWYGPIWGWSYAPHGWHNWGAGPMWHDNGPGMRYTGRGFGGGRFAENRFVASSANRTGSRAFNSANGSRNVVSGNTGTRTFNTRNNGRTGIFTTASSSDRTRTNMNTGSSNRTANRFSTNTRNSDTRTSDRSTYTTNSRNSYNSRDSYNSRNGNVSSQNQNSTRNMQNNGTRTVNTRNVNTRNTVVNTRNTNSSNNTRTVSTPTRSSNSSYTPTRSAGSGSSFSGGGRSGGSIGGGSFGGGSRGGGTGRR